MSYDPNPTGQHNTRVAQQLNAPAVDRRLDGLLHPYANGHLSKIHGPTPKREYRAGDLIQSIEGLSGAANIWVFRIQSVADTEIVMHPDKDGEDLTPYYVPPCILDALVFKGAANHLRLQLAPVVV